MKPKVLALILGIGLFLAGCSGMSGAGISAAIEGGVLGFEVDDGGTIVVVQSMVTFTSDPGAAGATVTGYSVRFMNDAGNPIPGLEYALINNNGLSVNVPPGIYCGEETDGACTVMNGGIARSMASEPVNLATLPGEIPVHMVSADHYPVYAIVTFNAERGSRSFTFSTRVSVINPFTGGDE